MPLVKVSEVIPASLARVWELVNDVESYPRFMEHVRSLKVMERGQTHRVSAWEVDCKGFIMRWTEREEIDEHAHRIDYRQIEGDLAVFEGSWQLEPLAVDSSRANLSVQFEIGIPMLSEMLNPVAQRAIQDNSQKMLASLALQAASPVIR